VLKLLIGLILFIPTLIIASISNLIPVNDIAALLPDWAQPKYSPDEIHFAYLAPDEQGAYNLCVNGTFLTHEKRGLLKFFWEKDSQHLLYLYDENGDEYFHLYRVDLKGRIEDLTPYEKTHINLISLSNKCPNEALITSTHEGDQRNFYRINLITKELTSFLPLRNDLNVFAGNEDLEPQAAISYRANGKKYLEVYENGSWHEIWELHPDDISYTPFLSVLSNQKLLIRTCTDLPAQGLYEINLQNGEKKLLFSHPKLDFDRAYFDPKTNAFQAAIVRYDQIEWHFFDPIFEAEINALYEKLPNGEIVLESRLAKDRKWLIVFRRDNHPNAYYLWDRDAQELELVLQEAPHLVKYSFGKLETFTFSASDGLEIQGYLLIPPYGKPPYSMILYPHGGPSARDSWGFNPHHQFLANRGYALLFVNYRGSDGFGTSFLIADKKEWGYRNYQDLLDAKEWAIEHGWTEQKRIAIKGGSFGGYLTLLGLTLNPSDFVCGIAEVPIVCPKTTWKNMSSYYSAWEQIYSESLSNARTPLDYAWNLKSPLLMIHSENDKRVVLRESQQMAEMLSNLKIPFEYHIFPGDGHHFRNPNNRRLYTTLVEEFLLKNLPIREENQ
jgi:pimeloyl-ACP methyl ester carboxylesterase